MSVGIKSATLALGQFNVIFPASLPLINMDTTSPAAHSPGVLGPHGITGVSHAGQARQTGWSR